jgi:hypothetical protein
MILEVAYLQLPDRYRRPGAIEDQAGTLPIFPGGDAFLVAFLELALRPTLV